ncbi:MAG: T9SS type A sorting domain-containing protein, partial [Bacteroidota bacterium]
QNTGTDTAFNVVIRDAISEYLNPNSIRPGASSHPYTWGIAEDDVLFFNFENIMLPDSNINEPASHGFVKFKIKQELDNLPGTLIENSAGIYFDFNAPVITNTSVHQIEERFFLLDTIYNTYCDTHLFSMDTTILQMGTLTTYDFEISNQIHIAEDKSTSLDTTITLGLPFNDVIYQSDTMLLFPLMTWEGCDSLVSINLHLDDPELGESGALLYPNPSNGQSTLLFKVKAKQDISIVLYNQIGELVSRAPTKYFEPGHYSFPLDYSFLPKGIYLLVIDGAVNNWVQKIVIW